MPKTIEIEISKPWKYDKIIFKIFQKMHYLAGLEKSLKDIEKILKDLVKFLQDLCKESVFFATRDVFIFNN